MEKPESGSFSYRKNTASREDKKMSAFSDDHLAQFRVQSDRAFEEMQANADREMANFLRL